MTQSIKSAVRFVTITENEAGQRVDNYLMAQFRQLPKSRIYRMIRNGEVRVDKARVKANTRLNVGEIIRLPPVTLPKSRAIEIPQPFLREIERSIVANEEHFLIIDKPSGVAVHSGTGVEYGIIDAIRAQFSDHPFFELVHRLDRDTSGLLLIAKNRPTLLELQAQPFKRLYQLLVAGHWSDSLTKIAHPLRTDHRIEGERHVIIDQESGVEAETLFKPLQYFNAKTLHFTLLEAELITGRTHQIRVHTQSAQHPIIGDERYGDSRLNQTCRTLGLDRLMLHASILQFTISGREYSYHSPLPSQYLKQLNVDK